MKLTHGSLFSGIGGFDLAAEWAGFENIFHCEWNPFGRQVLEHHFPNTDSYGDITKTDFTKYRGQITVLSGGFPCQPFSLAGKRDGADDERYLWPEMLRAIKEIQPLWVIGENVAGITSMVQPGETIRVENQASLFEADSQDITVSEHEFVIETICRDFEAAGYSVQPVVIPACAVGAPHRRNRIWFIANAESVRLPRGRGQNGDRSEDSQTERSNLFCRIKGYGSKQTSTDTSGERPHGRFNTDRPKSAVQLLVEGLYSRGGTAERRGVDWSQFPTQSPLYIRNDGIPRQLAGWPLSDGRWREESVKACGNAIVPQVAYEILKGIKEIETNKQ